MPKGISRNLIAPCGMNCGVCKAYLRRKNPCPGCRKLEQNIPISIVRCRMRLCRKRTGDFCCDCAEFPCDRLSHLDLRYRTHYGMSEIENLEFIRDQGIRRFLDHQRRKYISEKGVLCVHDGKHYNFSVIPS
jgi:hypothetical protein